MFAIEGMFRRLPIAEFWHPVIGALGFGLIGLLDPRALGVGYDEISSVLAGKLAAATLAFLVITKLAAWWFFLASGTSGGTLAPLLLISGGFGSLVGTLVGPGLAGGTHLAGRIRPSCPWPSARRSARPSPRSCSCSS